MWERELRPVCYVRSRAARSPRDAPLRTCVAGLLRLELVLHPGLVHDNVLALGEQVAILLPAAEEEVGVLAPGYTHRVARLVA